MWILMRPHKTVFGLLGTLDISAKLAGKPANVGGLRNPTVSGLQTGCIPVCGKSPKKIRPSFFWEYPQLDGLYKHLYKQPTNWDAQPSRPPDGPRTKN